MRRRPRRLQLRPHLPLTTRGRIRVLLDVGDPIHQVVVRLARVNRPGFGASNLGLELVAFGERGVARCLGRGERALQLVDAASERDGLLQAAAERSGDGAGQSI